MIVVFPAPRKPEKYRSWSWDVLLYVLISLKCYYTTGVNNAEPSHYVFPLPHDRGRRRRFRAGQSAAATPRAAAADDRYPSPVSAATSRAGEAQPTRERESGPRQTAASRAAPRRPGKTTPHQLQPMRRHCAVARVMPTESASASSQRFIVVSQKTPSIPGRFHSMDGRSPFLIRRGVAGA
jgi:hypothetical protein